MHDSFVITSKALISDHGTALELLQHKTYRHSIAMVVPWQDASYRKCQNKTSWLCAHAQMLGRNGRTLNPLSGYVMLVGHYLLGWSSKKQCWPILSCTMPWWDNRSQSSPSLSQLRPKNGINTSSPACWARYSWHSFICSFHQIYYHKLGVVHTSCGIYAYIYSLTLRLMNFEQACRNGVDWDSMLQAS